MKNDGIDRRAMLALGGLAASAAAAPGLLQAMPDHAALRVQGPLPDRWGRGIEGQRRADLGNGMFRNPVLAGDYPDPSILKDGDDYYLTHSSFDAATGLMRSLSRSNALAKSKRACCCSTTAGCFWAWASMGRP